MELDKIVNLGNYEGGILMLLVPEEQIREYTYQGVWGSKTIVDMVFEKRPAGAPGRNAH